MESFQSVSHQKSLSVMEAGTLLQVSLEKHEHNHTAFNPCALFEKMHLLFWVRIYKMGLLFVFILFGNLRHSELKVSYISPLVDEVHRSSTSVKVLIFNVLVCFSIQS